MGMMAFKSNESWLISDVPLNLIYTTLNCDLTLFENSKTAALFDSFDRDISQTNSVSHTGFPSCDYRHGRHGLGISKHYSLPTAVKVIHRDL
jgi:hypothetical protein